MLPCHSSDRKPSTTFGRFFTLLESFLLSRRCSTTAAAFATSQTKTPPSSDYCPRRVCSPFVPPILVLRVKNVLLRTVARMGAWVGSLHEIVRRSYSLPIVGGLCLFFFSDSLGPFFFPWAASSFQDGGKSLVGASNSIQWP